MSEMKTGFLPAEIGGKKYDVDLSGQNIVKVTDKGGNSIHYQLFEGEHMTPLFRQTCLKGVKGFKMRSDDIYIAGYPRTGTNWTYEMASMLLNGNAETIPRLKDHLEIVEHEDFEKLPSPRVINCHFRMLLAPEEVKLKKTKIVYTLRDPRDVAVSVYRVYYGRQILGGTYMGSFGDFLQLFMAGTVDNNGYFDHLLEAEKYFAENPDIPVHFQKYEDTIQNPVGSVQKLSDFLGLPRNDDLCRAIAEKCEFKKLKADKDPYTLKYDGENVLYRKGIAGDWKNHFSDEMLDDYYRFYDVKMAGSRFYKLFSRDQN